jgi:hypothetical protein
VECHRRRVYVRSVVGGGGVVAVAVALSGGDGATGTRVYFCRWRYAKWMNGYTHSIVVAHQIIPASLPMVAAHTSRVVAVVVANDLVTIWLVIGRPRFQRQILRSQTLLRFSCSGRVDL